MTFKRLCKADDVEVGKLGVFNLSGKEILVANSRGRFFCLTARCTHADAPLVNGILHDEILECPWHEGKFRITDGAVLSPPPERPLETYPCFLRGKYLYVQLPSN